MRVLALLLVSALIAIGYAQPQAPTPGPGGRLDMGIDQKLGGDVPLDLPFFNEAGKEVRLGDYFVGKPVVFVPVFYKCQGVCLLELEGALKAFRSIKKYSLGDDYVAITFSIHPKETPDMARAKRDQVVPLYGRAGGAKGWHFLVGNQESITKLTAALGFRFVYDPVKDVINHPAGIMICTPKGKISQYFINTEFSAPLVMKALETAGAGGVGTETEPIWFGCLSIDPKTGAIAVNVRRSLLVGGFLTVIVLFTSIAVMTIKSRAAERAGGGGNNP